MNTTPDKCQTTSLREEVAKSFNEYVRQYDICANEEGYTFIYSSADNLKIYTDIDKWTDHLVGTKEQYQSETRSLLETLFFSGNDFIKALERFSANQKKREILI